MFSSIFDSLSEFPHAVCEAYDVENEQPRLGFVANGMEIHDVKLSECWRFIGNPAMYGLTPGQFDGFKAITQSLELLVAQARRGEGAETYADLEGAVGLTLLPYAEFVLLDDNTMRKLVIGYALQAFASQAPAEATAADCKPGQIV